MMIVDEHHGNGGMRRDLYGRRPPGGADPGSPPAGGSPSEGRIRPSEGLS
ncbi:hypothetical protein ATKI12_4035 [Kitasatospora sp. Ki12]